MARGEHLHRRERMAGEALLIRGDRAHDGLHEVNLAALEHRERFAARRHVHQPHLHVRIARGVVAQKIGKDALDEVRRSRDAQHPDIAAPQDLRLLAHRAGIVQQPAAIVEQPLALRSSA